MNLVPSSHPLDDWLLTEQETLGYSHIGIKNTVGQKLTIILVNVYSIN